MNQLRAREANSLPEALYAPVPRSIIEIVAVGPRTHIYEETIRLLQKNGRQ